MSTRRLLAGLAFAAVAAVPATRGLGAWRARALRADIHALEAERDELRRRVDTRMEADPRLRGMPDSPLRVGVPTSLLREVLERTASGVLDQVRLELADLHIRQRGEVRKLVSVGSYDLDVTIDSLVARLRAGKPALRFGEDEVAVALPVTIESGAGRATLHFVWKGKNVSGALCGDLDVRQVVAGRVPPQQHLLRGALLLRATSDRIVATPRFPPTALKLPIEPSPESWRAVTRILARKKGACGFVLDALDVPALLRGTLRRGITVHLPTEKVPALSLPIGIEPTLDLAGRPLTLAIHIDQLAITRRDLWLGASASLRPEAAASVSATGVSDGVGLSARTTRSAP